MGRTSGSTKSEVDSAMTIEPHVDDAPLEATDFRALDWAAFAVRNADDLSTLTRRIEEAKQASTTARAQRALQVLHDLSNLRLDHRDAAERPFHGTFFFDRLQIPELAALLESKLPDEPNLLRAFATDLAWWARRQCSPDAVRIAVRDYLGLARRLVDPQPSVWVPCNDFLRRAAALGASMKRGGEMHVLALDTAFELLTSVRAERSYFSQRVALLMLEHRDPRCDQAADLLEPLAQRMQSEKLFDQARDYLDVVVQIRARANDPAVVRAAKRRVAEVVADHAAHAVRTGHVHLAAQQQEESVRAWQAAGAKAEADAARVELQRLQRLALAEMKTVTFEAPPGLDETWSAARRHVSGLSWPKALHRLVLSQRPNRALEPLRESAKDASSRFMFYALAPARRVSGTGRTVRTRPSTLDDLPAALEDIFQEHLHFDREWFACGAIQVMADTIQLEHGLSALALRGDMSRSSFVPERRVSLFARGLALGFQGDFVMAAHLLIPQFEHALREQLEARGAVVSTLPSSGEQNEKDLGKLLDLKEAVELLGENEVVELKSLLVEKAGANLRNRLAHGLLDDGEGTGQMIYFWWKVLQYVYLPLFKHRDDDSSSGSDSM